MATPQSPQGAPPQMAAPQVLETPRVSILHENFPHLSEGEWSALMRMGKALGEAPVKHLFWTMAPAEQRAAALNFMEHEIAHHKKTDVVKLDTSTFSGSPKEPLLRWFVELETAIAARGLTDPALQVAYGMSRLAGRARSWAFGKRLADPSAFSTLQEFKRERQLAFEPPENEFRVRVAFLRLRQGTMDLHAYVQRVRYLLSTIVTAPVDAMTQLAVFMAGLRDGPVKTMLFRKTPASLDDAINAALREEFELKQSNLKGFRDPPSGRNDGPEPMDIDAITPGQRGDKSRRDLSKIKCFICQRLGHLVSKCRAPAPSSGAQSASGGNGARKQMAKTKTVSRRGPPY